MARTHINDVKVEHLPGWARDRGFLKKQFEADQVLKDQFQADQFLKNQFEEFLKEQFQADQQPHLLHAARRRTAHPSVGS